MFELDPALLPPPRPSSVVGGDVGALQARLRELETQNALMQRELDHMSEVAQRQDQQLRWGWGWGGVNARGLVALGLRGVASINHIIEHLYCGAYTHCTHTQIRLGVGRGVPAAVANGPVIVLGWLCIGGLSCACMWLGWACALSWARLGASPSGANHY